MKKFKYLIFSIIIVLILFARTLSAQTGGGVSFNNFLKLSGTSIIPINTLWRIGNSATNATFNSLTVSSCTGCGGGSGGTGNVATSTTETAGQLPYWTSTGATPATLGKVATTSVTCAGTVSCTSFTAIGPSPITLTGSGSSITGTTGQTVYMSGTNTAVGTSTMFITTSGQVGFGTTSPTTNAFVTIQATTTNPMAFYVASTTGAQLFEIDGSTGFTSVGSTTPWAKLSVNPTALGSGVPEFAIGSSSATHLVVTGAGLVGIGTTTPPSILTIGTVSPFTVNPVLLLGTSTLSSASANGTYIGANAPTGFVGNFIHTQVNGSDKFRVDSTAKIYLGTAGANMSPGGSGGTEVVFDTGLVSTGGRGVVTNNITGANILIQQSSGSWQPVGSSAQTYMTINPGGSNLISTGSTTILSLGAGFNFGSSKTYTGQWRGTDMSYSMGEGANSIYNGTFPASALQIDPTINMANTSNTGYTALRIIPTETLLSTAAGVTNYLMTVGTSTNANLFDITNAGNVGIGTTSPYALLDTFVASSTAGTNQSKPFARLLEMTIAGVYYLAETFDYYGHLITSGPVPTLSSCGTNPTIQGNDRNMRIYEGSAAGTSCTATFAKPWVNPPICQVNQETGTAATLEASSTPTAIVITGAGVLSSDAFTVHCEGYQ